MKYKPLPIGYEDYRRIQEEGYYYIDKTLFIKELLDKKAMVNLFTRPRRFGKTLMLSMLKYFFEDAYGFRGEKLEYKQLFNGMKIMEAGDVYTKHMGKYPVISLTLKSGKQSTLESSMEMLRIAIADEFKRHNYILDGDSLIDSDYDRFCAFRDRKVPCSEYKDSLKFLSQCLRRWSGMDVIILIDEYDVPLEGAYSNGFYLQMIDFIRELLSSCLKTNDSLYFAVITGCLRISKESIFTGLNNLEMNSVLTPQYGEYFGFTIPEVKKMCEYYGLADKYAELRDWYDGYLFGDTEVYNPWSTIRYIKDHLAKRDEFPISYWANTSSNSIVRTLIDRANREVKDEIEHLIAGGTIEKQIHEDITYAEIEEGNDIANLWNFMFFTGYFKIVSSRFEDTERYATLTIPNQEVYYIFKNKIQGWFYEKLVSRNAERLFDAIRKKDTMIMEEEIGDMLYSTISYHDYYENFYHGFMTGILYGMDRYKVKSNHESGNGRTDIYMLPRQGRRPAYIFEFKCAKRPDDMEKMAKEALQQIEEKRYVEELDADGYHDVVKYGIAFCEKDCIVMCGE